MFFCLCIYAYVEYGIRKGGSATYNENDYASTNKLFLDVMFFLIVGWAIISVFALIPHLICAYIFRPIEALDVHLAVKYRYGLGLCIQLTLLYFVYTMILILRFKNAYIFWFIKHVAYLVYAILNITSYIKHVAYSKKYERKINKENTNLDGKVGDKLTDVKIVKADEI